MNYAKIHDLAIARPQVVVAKEPSALRGWRSRTIAPARPSGLQSVLATVEPRYRRGEFYLKIEGLTGPRTRMSVKMENQ